MVSPPDTHVDNSTRLSGGVRLEHTSIALEGGWSGAVLTRWEDAGSISGRPSGAVGTDDWAKVLRSVVDGGADLAERVVLKRSGGMEVLRGQVDVGGGALGLVCKHSKCRGIRGGMLGLLSKSRARRNFDCACALLRAGLPTAMPIAMLERGRLGRESWFITEAVSGAVDLDGLMSRMIHELPMAEGRRLKQLLCGRLAELCARLAGGGFRHRDFKASNILVTEWDRAAEGPRLWLVDLDGVRRGRGGAMSNDWRSIVRLGASLAECRSVTSGDRVRFLREYLELRDGGALSWRSCWGMLATRVADYNIRSASRKRGKLDGYTGA